MDVLLVILVIIVGVVVAGILFEQIQSARERQQFPPPGKLVDVGGHRLHIEVDGTQHVGLTVVFEAGAGSPGLDWRLVQPQVAAFARTVIYDRAGYGWSETGPKPRTSDVLATELHTLLHNANVPGPYVLVAHSFGGLYVRRFAALYPDEVAGMVLVDTPHEALLHSESYGLAQELKRLRRASFMRRIGLIRLLCKQVFRHVRLLPEDQQPVYMALNLRHTSTVVDEVQAVLEGPDGLPEGLGDLPLVVISRSPVDTERSHHWQAHQEQLAAFSTHGERMVAEKGGAYVHLDQPELVVDAVRRVLGVST